MYLFGHGKLATTPLTLTVSMACAALQKYLTLLSVLFLITHVLDYSCFELLVFWIACVLDYSCLSCFGLLQRKITVICIFTILKGTVCHTTVCSAVLREDRILTYWQL